MGLFVTKDFITHAGLPASWKIECDALTDEDWETLAKMISEYQEFSHVQGIPNGGLKLGTALQKYAQPESTHPVLIVDDVLTTGTSMLEAKSFIESGFLSSFPYTNQQIVGWVVFARGPTPQWIKALFQMPVLV